MRPSRRDIVLWGTAASLMPLAGCGQRDNAWNLSLPWSIREFHTANAQRFAREVRAATGDALDIRVHPGAVLGVKGPETIRVLEEGIVEMAEFPSFQGVGEEPLLGLESLPFLVRTQADLRTLYDVLRPELDRLYAAHGLAIAYIVPWPNQNIYLKFRPRGLADLQGLKIRTYDRNTSDLMTRLGLTPVQMPSQDVVPALASGMIDAVMTSTTTGAAQRYWEFLSYIYRTNHVWISNIMGVGLRPLDRLAADERAAFEDTARRLEPDFWRVSAADDADKLKLLVDNGIEVVQPDPALIDEMQALARPMWLEFIARVGPLAGRIVEEYLARTSQRPL